MQLAVERMEAEEQQRVAQQGLGNRIVSTMFHDHRMVAVGSTVYWSKNWKTFHDFLLDYIKAALGQDWGANEQKKPIEQRHPIMQWCEKARLYREREFKDSDEDRGKIRSSLVVGAVAAYLGLAYNLYLLAHNKAVQARLVKRLKDPNAFQGAHYEVFVAACFIKAGFIIEFENEEDSTSTHCEFTVTCRNSGAKYSVEAKSRHRPGGLGLDAERHAVVEAPLRLGQKLHLALKKKAGHARIVFFDANVPDNKQGPEMAPWLEEALATLDREEPTMLIDGMPAPSAYVFVTNHPYQYNLMGSDYKCVVLAQGFKIPDFKMGKKFPSLREALKARDLHADMYPLITSMREHYEIPSTFSGEAPEFAFGEAAPRIKIGGKHSILQADGTEAIGELIDAIVVEEEKVVFGAFVMEDGKSILTKIPITDAELAAYRRHPETFFGVVRKKNRKIRDGIDAYDFLYASYKNTAKEKLLDFMKDHHDIEDLRQQSQEELAVIYCERIAYAMLAGADSQKKHDAPNS